MYLLPSTPAGIYLSQLVDQYEVLNPNGVSHLQILNQATIRLSQVLACVRQSTDLDGYDAARYLVYRMVTDTTGAYSAETLTKLVSCGSGRLFTQAIQDLITNVLPILGGTQADLTGATLVSTSILVNHGAHRLIDTFSGSELAAMIGVKPALFTETSKVTDSNEITSLSFTTKNLMLSLERAAMPVIQVLNPIVPLGSGFEVGTVTFTARGGAFVLDKSTPLTKSLLSHIVAHGYTDVVSRDARGRLIRLPIPHVPYTLGFYRHPAKSPNWTLFSIDR